MNFLTAIHTDKGIKKSTNQDSALIMEASTDLGKVLLAVVCDGMGGLAKGEVASSTVVRAFGQWFENELPVLLTLNDPGESLFESWRQLVYQQNIKISNYGRSNGFSLGTTVVALLLFKEKYYIINIGDSRVYCISDSVYQLTKDQTYVQREIDCGRMTPEEAKASPKANVLLQCVGASDFIDPDFYSGPAGVGQVFLLCSDGFRHVLAEQELFQYLNPYAVEDEQVMKENSYYLTEVVKSRRELDNITALLVKLD